MRSHIHPLLTGLTASGLALLMLAGCGDKGDTPAGQQASKQQAAGQKAAAPKAPAPKAPAPKATEAPTKGAAAHHPAEGVIDKAFLAPFKPLPDTMDDDQHPTSEARVKLGRMLYFEKRLSKNHDISCNTCHQLDNYGVDGEPTSPGHKGQRGGRNSPTVYNAAGHLAQFWDGRAADVETQAKGPVLNPIEMAMVSEEAVLTTLKSMPEYVAAFKAAFPEAAEAVTYDHFAQAVGAFERKLVTPSRWDAFLKGQSDALTQAEKDGFMAFSAAGCTACHMGTYLGGSLYQKAGLVKPWPNQKDRGRFEVTQKEADQMMFKVPSLRNITKTGPYFHDGSVADLAQAVKMMADHQLGRSLPDSEVALIVTFLGALTGEVDAELIKAPTLPPSTDATPKPDPS